MRSRVLLQYDLHDSRHFTSSRKLFTDICCKQAARVIQHPNKHAVYSGVYTAASEVSMH